MKVEILISSVNSKILRYLDNFRPENELEYLIINQISEDRQILSAGDIDRDDIRIFNYHESGLSCSRNRALELARGDICLLADDDVRYIPEAISRVREIFATDRPDVATFCMLYPDSSPARRYPDRIVKHNLLSIMKVSSVEIAFRREVIVGKNIRFDEKFGLGGIFPSGEENIFLRQCLIKKLQVKFYPINLVIHDSSKKSGKLDDLSFARAKGAMFARMFPLTAPLWSLLFACKKIPYFARRYTLWKYYKSMLAGIREYKEESI